MVRINYPHTIGPDLPHEDFEGLTTEEMFWCVNADIGDDQSPLRLNHDINAGLVQAVRFYRHVVQYLTMLQGQQPLRLTQRGNLPAKFCSQLSDMGIFESEYVKDIMGKWAIRKETDNFYVHIINVVTQIAGFARKKHGKISLTGQASEYLETRLKPDLFLDLIKAYAIKFNWEYHDRHPDSWLIQGGLGFSVYLVQKYGINTHAVRFYAEKYWRAFPELMSDFPDTEYRFGFENFESCYCLRVFERFLLRFGLINKEPNKEIFVSGSSRITKTTLLDQIFVWKKGTRVE